MSASRSTRPPALTLISSVSPARPVSTSPSPSRSSAHPHAQLASSSHHPPYSQSQSPFRYVSAPQGSETMDEKRQIVPCEAPMSPLGVTRGRPADRLPQPGPSMINEKQGFHEHTAHPAHPDGRASRPPRPRSHPRLQSHQRSSSHRGPLPLLHSVPMTSRSHPLSTPTRSFRRTVLCQRLKPWLPFILYAMTSLGFVLAISLWKTEVFQALDELSHWLRAEEYTGYGILFVLIFVTTFPPMPLYSTFTILSGYTYGPWTGAVISYFAALSGAITVFVLSRTYFRQWINRCLSHTVTMKRVVRAIEKRPKLLFLVRLAPYPYNMMNALLAGSPTLTFRTYTVCTALSLFKLIIHTSIGSGIHSFANYHTVPAGEKGRDADEDWLNQAFTIGGIALCVAIAGYLSCVARKAVDDELEDDLTPHDSEERVAFLASDPEILGEEMVETQAGCGVPPPHTRFEFSGREEAMVGLY